MEEHEGKRKAQVGPVLREYWRVTIAHPVIFAFCLFGAIALQAISIIGPLYLKELIDLIATALPSEETARAALMVLGAFGGVSFLGWVARRIETRSVMAIETRVMADLSNEAFSHLIRHSHDFFISNFVGTLTRRVGRYARAYEQVFDSIFRSFLPAFLFAVGVIAVLWLRSPWIGIALLAWSVIAVSLQYWLANIIQKYRVRRAAEDSKMTGALSDAIGNHASVTLFAGEAIEERTFAERVEAWRAALWKSWNIDDWVWAAQGLFAIIAEVGLLVAGIYAWQNGYITVGDFVLIQVYVIGLIDRLWGIGHTMRRLYEAFADASEMIDIYKTPHGIEDAPHAAALAVSGGAVSFDAVSFWFESERPVLSDFKLDIKAGERVALVGPSGAGKSTITKLLLRLYDPTAGAVHIDGQDIRAVTQTSLREAIAFVPQEPALFHRTLKDNIRYGKQDATDEEVIEAAKKAHCHAFISRLPDGYDTYVGERGVKLSGGERQRVAIARAILKDAPILVLDEATSSLDSESEALIQDALKTLMEGKTVIVIAHRLSTIMRMDRIIVIENGAIAAEGTHTDLINQTGGLYKKLWDIQAGSFVAE